MLITSLQNPKIKQVIRLRDRRDRDREGLFLIEGYRELLRAVDANRKMEELFFCPELFLGSNEQSLIDRIRERGAEVYSCTKAVFEKISYRDRPDGLLATSKQHQKGITELKSYLASIKTPFLVIAEAIEKPGNLGTILRTADAVGADALIVCDKCTDIHNPNVVRASVGTLFTVPVFEMASRELIPFLKEKNIQIVAATPSGDREYTSADFRKAVAIAFGTEQYGLSDLWMAEADLQLKIPMKGVADSLNVAISTGVLLYEVLRQRCL